MAIFEPTSQHTDDGGTWFYAGLTSSFPDIAVATSSTFNPKIRLCDPAPSTSRPSSDEKTSSIETPAVKIFRVPNPSTNLSKPIELTTDEALSSVGLEDQVLIFQHRGKIHAVNHQCPHRSYPLSRGMVYDIEDFGIILSAGITCPKHGWAFDLHTGESDRGAYVLKVWDVQIREHSLSSEDDDNVDKEVWVRRRNG